MEALGGEISGGTQQHATVGRGGRIAAQVRVDDRATENLQALSV